jgi:hypothetical protein
MKIRLFTIVSEFLGTTSIMQVPAADVVEAAKAWARRLGTEAPFGLPSERLAAEVEAGIETDVPVPIAGLPSVWCLSALCDGQPCLANIVETIPG